MTTATPTKKSTARDARTVKLVPTSTGSYMALSSDGHTYYAVALDRGEWRCECRGYISRATCCHTSAARLARLASVPTVELVNSLYA